MLNEPIRVLIVDDDEVDRQVARRALSESDMKVEVDEAATAADALRAARERPHDAILLDYRLPDMDGLQALDALRHDGIKTPVVMVTGHGSEQVAVDAIKRGASDYISKDSLTPHRLAQTIKNVVLTNRLATAVEAQERFALVGVLANTALEGVETGIEQLEQLLIMIETRITSQLKNDPRLGKTAESLQEEYRDTLGDLVDLKTTLETLRRLVLGGPQPVPTDLDALVSTVVESAKRVTPRRITLEFKPGRATRVPLDPVAARQVVQHLLNNAIEAMPEGGTARIVTKVEPDAALLIVEDDGRGVPQELGNRIFDLFITTKEDHEGLGLTLVRHLVQTHGGTVRFENRAEGGARFVARLPLRTG